MAAPQIDIAAMGAALQQAQQHIAQQAQQLQQLQQAQAQAQQAQQVQANAAVGPGRLKAPSPPTFKGDMLAVDEFLRAQKQQHAFYGADLATDAAKLKFVAVHMSGAAAQWFETQQASAAPIATWAEFEDRFLKRYRPVKAEMAARQRLSQLKQRATTSVSVYASLFQSILSPITDMSEKDKLFSFIQGLLPSIQIRMWEKEPLSLADAINTAVSIEAMLSFGRHGMLPQGYGGARNHGSSGAASSSSSSGAAVHMDLSNMSLGTDHASEMDPFALYALEERAEPSASDHAAASAMLALQKQFQALEHRLQNMSYAPKNANNANDRVPGLKADDIKKLMKEGRCFRCKKTGHMKNDCPQGN
jgi:hypothetical protein